MESAKYVDVRIWNRLDPLPRMTICLVSWLLATSTPAGVADHSVLAVETAVGPDNTPRAHVGDTVTTAIRVINSDTLGASITVTSIVHVVLRGTVAVVSTNLLSVPAHLLSLGRAVTVSVSSVVLDSDGDWFLDYAQVGGTANFDGPGGTHVAQAFQAVVPGQVQIFKPCLQVGVSSNSVPDGTGAWVGSLTNCGNTLLTGVVVSNLVNGVFLPVFGPIDLDAQHGLTWTADDLGGGSLVAWGTDGLGLTVSSALAAAPRLLAVAQKGDSIAFSWNAIPGRHYQLQSRTDLAGADWSNLGDPVGADGPVAGSVDHIGSDQRRFYRVVLLP